jgi:hypothetical protein
MYLDGRSVGDAILHGRPAASAYSSPELRRGRQAFALEQAHRERRLRVALTRLWLPPLCAARDAGTEGVHVPPEEHEDPSDAGPALLDAERVLDRRDG